MDVYKSIDIFILYNRKNNNFSEGYLSRGVAIDKLINKKNFSKPSKEILFYKNGTALSKVTIICKVIGIEESSKNELYRTSWFPYEQRQEFIDNLNEGFHSQGVGKINTNIISIKFNPKQYYETNYPCFKIIRYNKRGNLFNKHIRRANTFGIHDNKSKMVFYVDNRCENILWEGEAIINPTYVCKDYGFIDCRMCLYSPAEDDLVFSRLNLNSKEENNKLYNIAIPGYGSYWCKIDESQEDENYVSGVFFEWYKGSFCERTFKMNKDLFESFLIK